MPPLILALVFHFALVQAQVAGIVRDTTGAPIADASLTFQLTDGRTVSGRSGQNGTFTVAIPSESGGTLIVMAPGFAAWRRTLPSAGLTNVQVELAPAGLLETVTVTPVRSALRLGDVPASLTVLGRDQLSTTPAVMADDVLRRVPSFSLFRRTSSAAAHPTAQGVSLRGIGPSGVSRTLVLVDGLPVNDPFGGWVYWSRIPVEHAQQIEVVETPTASLYGNYALGGVIQVVGRTPSPSTLSLRAGVGSLDSRHADAYASHATARAGASVDAAWFDTRGYSPVIAVNPAGIAERGLVDNDVSLTSHRVNLRTELTLSPTTRALVRAGYFTETRNNGKHSTFTGDPEDNDTRAFMAHAAVRGRAFGEAEFDAGLSVDDSRFHSRFLAVPAATPPRSVGRMTLQQTVPARAYSAYAQARRDFGAHAISAGADWRWVDGDSEEHALDAQTGTTITLRRVSGATQQSRGAFAQYVFTGVSRLTLTAGLRADQWRTYDGHNLEFIQPSGQPTAAHAPSLPERSDNALSVRLATLVRLTDRVSAWGHWAQGFRAPTLNELYRQFRVGTVLTLANNQLGPETLRGGEVGVQIIGPQGIAFRAAWFDNRFQDAVSNVTISSAGAPVTQQRQNVAATRATGVQAQADMMVGAHLRLSAAYVHQRSSVTRHPINPALEGKGLPQVPRHRGTMTAIYANPGLLTASLEVTAMSRQFDDDLNARIVPGLDTPGLPGYTVVNGLLSRRIGERIEVFASGQNLLSRQYFVGLLPTTVGSPRVISGGLRVRLGRP